MLKHNDSCTELLTILQEECAEVIQRVSKVKRFGQDKHNLDLLAKEVGDLVCMIELLQQWEVVSYTEVEEARIAKMFKLRTWSNLFDYDSDETYDASVRSDN